MEALIYTEQNSTWFHEIIKPVTELLSEQKVGPEHDSAKKLCFDVFVRLLLYFYLQGLDSLRSLITDLKTNVDISTTDLCVVGLSTIHDAFHRYCHTFLYRMYTQLLQVLTIGHIKELDALGRFVISDGSIFPTAISNFWAAFKEHSRALKLHLHFELNQMIPSCFLVTPAKSDERNVLAQLLEKAVTYIADRGYVSFEFFKKIVDAQAYFIIRSRKNFRYHVKKQLTAILPENVRQMFLHLTDEFVWFEADKYQQTYRRICFRIGNTMFVLITNRLDLDTYTIIRLYALRWQIELFFRSFKRMYNALHLINTSQNGVTIQFYVILMVNLLLLHMKQRQMQLYLFDKQQRTSQREHSYIRTPEDFMSMLGSQIPSCFKIKKQEMRAIRNNLLKATQLAFEFS